MATFDTAEELLAECQRISRNVARGYAVDPDDLAQEVFIVAWASRQRAENVTNWLYSVAEFTARDMHEKEMLQSRVMQYHYTTRMTALILEKSFFYDNWETVPMPDSARSAPRGVRPMFDQDLAVDVHQSVPDPTDSRDLCADVQISLDRLEFQDRQLLIERYKFGQVPPRGTAKSKALSRALGRLCRELNNYRGQKWNSEPTGRRAISNAAAMARISGQWSGS